MGWRFERRLYSLRLPLAALAPQQRFVARKLSWFDNPSVGLEAEETERETVGIVESSRFQPSFSMAVAAQSFVQHTANKSNTQPATEHTDFLSPLLILSRSTRSRSSPLLPPFRSTPAFLSLSGKCTERTFTYAGYAPAAAAAARASLLFHQPCFARVQPLRFVVGFEECAAKGTYITAGDIKLKDFVKMRRYSKGRT